MKLIKLLMSGMFILTAVIQSAEVTECGWRHHYQGINTKFVIMGDNGEELGHSAQCGTNWADIESGIQYQLKQLRISQVEEQMARAEHKRLLRESRGLKGKVIKGDVQ